MRVFRDLDLVEHLGSGIPRILRSYGKECFKIHRELFTHDIPSFRKGYPASYPPSYPPSHPQVTPQVEDLIKILDREMNRLELQEKLNLSDRKHFRIHYLKPALEAGLIEMTKPEIPNSRSQKYRLTVKGIQIKEINQTH